MISSSQRSRKIMPKLWFVVKREYLTRVLTKGFIISTVAIPALIIGVIVFQFFVAEKQPALTQTITIVDEAGQLGDLIESFLARQKLPDGKPAFSVVQIQDSRATRRSLGRALRREPVRTG